MTIKVELLSAPGCSKCAEAKQALKSVVEDLGKDKVAWREVNLLEEIDYATDLGLMSSGGIAIDGKLVFPRMPSAAKLREELLRRLKG
ncbi:MAG: thioredoxin family protein [Betaproteobacteria bacterium]|nr:MAG: thioredoxin family protein [Betaproteobacteria bacterium]